MFIFIPPNHLCFCNWKIIKSKIIYHDHRLLVPDPEMRQHKSLDYLKMTGKCVIRKLLSKQNRLHRELFVMNLFVFVYALLNRCLL